MIDIWLYQYAQIGCSKVISLWCQPIKRMYMPIDYIPVSVVGMCAIDTAIILEKGELLR